MLDESITSQCIQAKVRLHGQSWLCHCVNYFPKKLPLNLCRGAIWPKIFSSLKDLTPCSHFVSTFGPYKCRNTTKHTHMRKPHTPSLPHIFFSVHPQLLLFICLSSSLCRTCVKMLKAGPPGL